MQRTGGTTLATLLENLSEHPSIEHEPFNKGRVFDWVLANWRDGNSVSRLKTDVDQVLQARPLLKHCYELVPDELNQTLMEATSDLGYCHIILDRRAEPNRILSLELAELTGAWGKQEAKAIYNQIEAGEITLDPIDERRALNHLVACQNKRRTLSDLLSDFSQDAFVVYFEDVFSDPEAGRVQIHKLFDFIGLDPNDAGQYEKQVDDALMNKGQNSARVMGGVPNLEDVRQSLSTEFQKDPYFFDAS